jgi:hypothetical protein
MRGASGLTAAVISVEDELGQLHVWREVGLEGLWRHARYVHEAEEARRAVLEEGEHGCSGCGVRARRSKISSGSTCPCE